MAPVVVVAAVKLIFVPAQIGVFPVKVGVAGGLGSDKEMGPTAAEVQPFKVAVILAYVPDAKAERVMVPLAVDVAFTAVAGLPLKV